MPLEVRRIPECLSYPDTVEDGRRELRPHPARQVLPMARKALIHQVEARERRGRWFGALASLLSIALLMSGWVALFAFLGTNSAYGAFEGIKEEWVPDTSAMPLNLPDPSRVSRIYA